MATYKVLFGARVVSRASITINVMLALVTVFSLVVVLVDSLQSVKNVKATAEALNYVELAVSLLFAVEYFVRLLCVGSDQIWPYIISFMGVVDLASAVPPVFALVYPPLSTLILLRVLKLSRTFRLFGAEGIFKAYSQMLDSVGRNTLKMVVFVIGMWSVCIVLGGFMFLLEGDTNDGFDNMFKAGYWAVVTLTTVGYGDSVPQTTAGKVLAALTMTAGYTFVVLGLRHFYDAWGGGGGAATAVRRAARRRRQQQQQQLPPGSARYAAPAADRAAAGGLVESKTGANGGGSDHARAGSCARYECRVRLLACVTMLHACATKLLLGGVGWVAMSTATGLNETEAAYWFAAGAGDALGVSIGQVIMMTTLACCVKPFVGWAETLRGAVILACGSFCSGSLWQPLAGWLVFERVDFNLAVLVEGTLCGLAFFVGISIANVATQRCSRPSRVDVVKDVTLSLGVAGATGMFIGTSTGWHGNWMQSFLVERNRTDLENCVSGGYANAMGFAVATVLLIFMVPPQFMWTAKSKASPPSQLP